MIIPGFIISLATFPGVIVHEAAHMLFCRIRRVAVLDVCFFRLGNPAGYVVHEPARDFTTAFLITVGPFIVNSLLCLAFCLPASVPVFTFKQEDPLSYFLLWLGVSIGMHAFPSTGDAANLWREAGAAAKQHSPLALLSFPLVVVIYIINALRVLWADYFYGLALGVYLPRLMLERLF
jgi:hypothetical protein